MLFKKRLKVIEDYHKWAKMQEIENGFKIPANFQSFMAYLDSRGYLIEPAKQYTRAEFEKWLYEIAINNAGTEYANNVTEIIHQLDGFERYVAEKREEGAANELQTMEEEIQEDSRQESVSVGR